MDKDDLKKVINFLEDLRHIKKKYDLDYHHLISKYYNSSGSIFIRDKMSLGHMFNGLSMTREREADVIDKWYEDYFNQLHKTNLTKSLTD